MHFLCFYAVSVVIYPQNRVYLSVFCVQYDTDFNAGKLSAFFLGKRSETNQESSVAVSCSSDRRVPSFYPVLSGYPVKQEFAEQWLEWLEGWVLS